MKTSFRTGWVQVAAAVAFSAVCGSAHALTITAHVTADNHYGLYYGQADGSGLRSVGQNEEGPSGSVQPPGIDSGYNWSHAETWKFDASHGDYLYLFVWDDGGPQAWIGDFTSSEGTLLTNATQWQYAAGNLRNPGEWGQPPSATDLRGFIENANWLSPAAFAGNGTDPWGTIDEVNPEAQFIWGDTFDRNWEGLSKYDALIFRTTKPAVAPEPATMVLLGTGLLGVAGVARRRRR